MLNGLSVVAAAGVLFASVQASNITQRAPSTALVIYAIPIGNTDQRGRLKIEEFYPEEFSEVGVESAGAAQWLFDPREEKRTGRRVFYLKP